MEIVRKNKLYILIIALFAAGFSGISAQVSDYGDFPYEQSLLGGPNSVPDIEFPTAQKTTNPNLAKFIKDLGLQLTPAAKSSFGAVFVDKRKFNSVIGIKIEFEYMMYGGTGGDGLSMFLFDASVGTPQIGAHGAGIGYAFNRSYNGSKTVGGTTIDFRPYRMTGLTGAYLGVALDQFGNNKGLRFQGDARIGGIPYSGTFLGTAKGMVDGSYNTQNQITLRGAKGPVINASYGLGDGYTGYPVLITQSTNNTDIKNGTQDRPGFVLDMTEGVTQPIYQQIKKYTGNLFPLSGGGEFSDPSNPAYRKVIIELFPSPRTDINVSTGFLVTVSIQHGHTTDVIISDFHYKTKFYYPENAYPAQSIGGSGDNSTDEIIRLNNPVYRELDAKVPEFLRVGFAASTGEETNNQVIKNLKISLPRAAEAEDDEAETDQGVSVSLMPLDNDIAYTGTISRNQIGKKEYIDYNTFRFRGLDGSVISGNSYTDTHGNIWTFELQNVSSPMDKDVKVTLKPHPTFYGEAQIKYDILGGRNGETPYNDPAYRSLAATITVDVKKSTVVYRNTISNKMVTPKLY